MTATPASRAQDILRELESRGDPANVAGMARYGIRSAKAFGVGAPVVRAMAKAIGTDRALASALWKTGALEARILAALIDDPARVTRAQMERWVLQFDNWALCDGACANLFDRTPFAVEQAAAWAIRPEEFVKRAGFVLMATLAVHDKAAPDAIFVRFLSLVEREADDPRNFVKKAVNWALRQIGKRNMTLHGEAVDACRRLIARPASAARWVGRDALRELTGEKTVARIRRRRPAVK
jgi:3-methyladenine DNA glycosylase AlkD